MENPKGSREKASKPVADQPADGSSAKEFAQLVNSYMHAAQVALLNAQMRQTQAIYDYYEDLRGATKHVDQQTAVAHVQELKSSLEQQDAQRYLDTQRKYWESISGAYVDNQKNYQQAVSAYSDTINKIWQDLQAEIKDKNENLAQGLKGAVAKLQPDPSNIALLTGLYYALIGNPKT